MSRARIRAGDVFAVPLGEKGYGYVHYLKEHPFRGPLLRVFDLLTDQPITTVESLRQAGDMFGPIYSSFWPAVKSGSWPFVGNMKVTDVTWPTMIGGHFGERAKRMHAWFLIHGDQSEYLGEYLPREYRHLEYAMLWSPESVEHRMSTGQWPPKSTFWLPFEDPPNDGQSHSGQ